MPMDLRETLGRPASEYASIEFVKVSSDETATEVASAMMKGGATEAVVAGRGGLISEKNLALGELQADVIPPELARPGGVRCSYCGSSARDSEGLSKHIDRIHVGLGLLEGNACEL